jgi:uncharacterized membrane protein
MSWIVPLVVMVALYIIQRSEFNRFRQQFTQQVQQLRTQIAALQQELKALKVAPPSSPSPEPKKFEQPLGTLAERLAKMAPPAEPEMTLDIPDKLEAAANAINTFPASAVLVEKPNLGSAPAAIKRVVVDEKSPAVTSSIGASIIAWFKGGNTIVRLAVVIIFIGVAFLLRYAAEHAVLPIEFRLAGVAIGAMALAGFGWRVRETRHGYGISLQGAGVGVLYLTVFAALRLYALIPAGLAFPLLIALAVITALLALLQDALALAVFGFTGAFLAPVLTSTGEGSHIALFSYFLIINIAITWIAQQRAWKLLNLVGFFFTFTIGIGWGLRSWQPELLWSTEPFLIAHLLLYLWISVGYSRQLAQLEQPKLPYVDGTLVFGTPIIAFGLQAGMMKHIPYGLALSAAAMSGIYLWLGLKLWRQMGEKMRLLSEGMLALGVVFLFLIAPLALDARWTSAAWALQGAGVAWIAVRQQRTWALLLGLLMQFGAALAFYNHPWPEESATLFFNARYFGVMILSIAALFSARNLEFAARRTATLPSTHTDKLQMLWTSANLRAAHWLMLVAGLLWLLSGTWQEIVVAPWAIDQAHRFVAMLAVVALLLEVLYRRLDWPQFAIPARPLLIVTFAVALLATANHLSFLRDAWGYIWLDGVIEFLSLSALGIWLMRRIDQTEPSIRRSYAIEHLCVGWFIALQSGLLAYAIVAHGIARHQTWTPVALIAPAVAIALHLLKMLRTDQWPTAPHPQAWLRGFGMPWMLLLLAWSAVVNLLSDGSMAPLPYLPLLNPIDIGHALIAVFTLSLIHTCREMESETPRWLPLLLLIAAFWWLNSVLIRSLHHWADTPIWLDGALRFDLVQTSLSILWTLTALITMFIATRKAPTAHNTSWRQAWILGAALLGIVVVKLLLVDMSHSGTLQRIVSFLGVGLLMLVIGYISPMPPARIEKNSAEPTPV